MTQFYIDKFTGTKIPTSPTYEYTFCLRHGNSKLRTLKRFSFEELPIVLDEFHKFAISFKSRKYIILEIPNEKSLTIYSIRGLAQETPEETKEKLNRMKIKKANKPASSKHVNLMINTLPASMVEEIENLDLTSLGIPQYGRLTRILKLTLAHFLDLPLSDKLTFLRECDDLFSKYQIKSGGRGDKIVKLTGIPKEFEEFL